MALKRKWFISSYCLLVLLSLLPSLSFSNNQKRILAIYSYDPTFPAFRESVDALYQFFPPSDYEIDIEFLDSKRYPNGKLNKLIFEQVQTRIKERGNYDVVISANDNALKFCLDTQYKLFPQTPIIFWGVNNKALAMEQDSNPWVSGIVENTFIEKNLELIFKLHPYCNKIVAITDSTTTGLAEYRNYLDAKVSFPECDFETINIGNYSFGDFKNVVQQIDPDKIILILSAIKYKDGYRDITDSYSNFNTNNKKIIYSNYAYIPDCGFAGGRFRNNYEMMQNACSWAKKVLWGSDIKQFKVVEDLYINHFALDYLKMNEFNVSINNLPKSIQVLNKPTNDIKFEKHTIVSISILLVLFFVVLAFGLLRLKRKHNEEKSLRLNAENYISLFKDNHSIMLILDQDKGTIIDANDASCQFYGFTPDDFKKLKIEDIDKTPNLDLKKLIETIKKRNVRIQAKHSTQNGTIKDVEIHSGRIIFNNKHNLYAIVHDISDRIKQEKLLIEARKKAEESDYLKSAFLANMSHEIRTPMNSILGFSSLLSEYDLEKETHQKYLKLIQDNGELLLELINDIIDLSKIEANQLKINMKECQLNELMEDIHIQFHNQMLLNPLKEKIKLNLTCGIANPNLTIRTDSFRLKQILLNLLGNALKFTDVGEINFGYVLRDDSVLQFFVKDTGIGIPEHKRESIFQAFDQVEDTITRNYGGTGLGLSISKSLVEKLGGHIWVMSELNKGSRFYFTITTSINELQLN